jgi:hypothetical protein
MGEETFTKKMRSASKEIHGISDALVNAKLAFGEFRMYYAVLCFRMIFFNSTQ